MFWEYAFGFLILFCSLNTQFSDRLLSFIYNVEESNQYHIHTRHTLYYRALPEPAEEVLMCPCSTLGCPVWWKEHWTGYNQKRSTFEGKLLTKVENITSIDAVGTCELQARYIHWQYNDFFWAQLLISWLLQAGAYFLSLWRLGGNESSVQICPFSIPACR